TDRPRSTVDRGSSWTIACGAGSRASNGSPACSRQRSMPDPAWDALAAHASAMQDRSLRELFAAEPGRDAMHVEAPGWYLDYAKHRVTAETLRLLVALAEAHGLQSRIDAMFRGEHINVTEDRAALHVALRMPAGTSLVVDGVDVVKEVHRVLQQMST